MDSQLNPYFDFFIKHLIIHLFNTIIYKNYESYFLMYILPEFMSVRRVVRFETLRFVCCVIGIVASSLTSIPTLIFRVQNNRCIVVVIS